MSYKRESFLDRKKRLAIEDQERKRIEQEDQETAARTEYIKECLEARYLQKREFKDEMESQIEEIEDHRTDHIKRITKMNSRARKAVSKNMRLKKTYKSLKKKIRALERRLGNN